MMMVSAIHEMRIQLWAGRYNQVYAKLMWLPSGISAASDSRVVSQSGMSYVCWQFRPGMMLCSCQVAFVRQSAMWAGNLDWI